MYKGNRYRVPLGTYSPGKRVLINVDNLQLSIIDCETGEIYAEHKLCYEKGKLIGEKTKKPIKSESILEFEKRILKKLDNDPLVISFLKNIHSHKTRYYRAQLTVIENLMSEWAATAIKNGIAYCTDKNLYSAGELKSSIIYLEKMKESSTEKTTSTKAKLPSKYQGHSVEIRDLSVYENAMRRSTINE